jgi:hypothetical protein
MVSVGFALESLRLLFLNATHLLRTVMAFRNEPPLPQTGIRDICFLVLVSDGQSFPYPSFGRVTERLPTNRPELGTCLQTFGRRVRSKRARPPRSNLAAKLPVHTAVYVTTISVTSNATGASPALLVEGDRTDRKLILRRVEFGYIPLGLVVEMSSNHEPCVYPIGPRLKSRQYWTHPTSQVDRMGVSV